jgi:hypothetical protein
VREKGKMEGSKDTKRIFELKQNLLNVMYHYYYTVLPRLEVFQGTSKKHFPMGELPVRET